MVVHNLGEAPLLPMIITIIPTNAFIPRGSHPTYPAKGPGRGL
jgi:hypothetical protein